MITPEQAVLVYEAVEEMVDVWRKTGATADLGEKLTCGEVNSLAQVFLVSDASDLAHSVVGAHLDDCDEPEAHVEYVP